MKKLLFLAIGLLAAGPALADPMGEIAVYAVNAEVDPDGGSKDDGTGFGINGWWALSGPIFVHGEYQTAELDDSGLDAESLRLGGGYYAEASKTVGFVGFAEYVDFGSDLEEDGFGIHGGAVLHPTPMLGLFASLGYLSLTDTDGLEATVGASLKFTKQFGVFVDYRTYMASVDGGGDVDVNNLRGGVSFSFGSM